MAPQNGDNGWTGVAACRVCPGAPPSSGTHTVGAKRSALSGAIGQSGDRGCPIPAARPDGPLTPSWRPTTVRVTTPNSPLLSYAAGYAPLSPTCQRLRCKVLGLGLVASCVAPTAVPSPRAHRSRYRCTTHKPLPRPDNCVASTIPRHPPHRLPQQAHKRTIEAQPWAWKRLKRASNLMLRKRVLLAKFHGLRHGERRRGDLWSSVTRPYG